MGVNLNPDRICNWECVYRQVDGTTSPVYTVFAEDAR